MVSNTNATYDSHQLFYLSNKDIRRIRRRRKDDI